MTRIPSSLIGRHEVLALTSSTRRQKTPNRSVSQKMLRLHCQLPRWSRSLVQGGVLALEQMLNSFSYEEMCTYTHSG